MTQKERVLKALQSAGAAGVCMTDFLAPDVCDGGTPITRMAARVLDLKNEGHQIDCVIEAGVAVYVLRSEALVVTQPSAERKVVVAAPQSPVGGPMVAGSQEALEEQEGLFDNTAFVHKSDYYEDAA